MNWQRILIPVMAVVVLGAAWRAYGAPGLAIASGGLLMWLLLHFTRLMHVLKQAADRPVGWVGSAVMLNAKLKPRSTLLHVMAMTRSLGEPLSPKDQQPEVFRWTDPGGSSVTCEFADGRLVRWTLQRPEPAADPAGAQPQAVQAATASQRESSTASGH
ncbi:glycerate kinase [Ramlibacter sp. AN1015]|uniref:glycerate kinase n=1 Tax=Ramlibacter sp. AN1015 TaxID=3133428 RepID=UPI0030C221FB